jgi:hypothetical protein
MLPACRQAGVSYALIKRGGMKMKKDFRKASKPKDMKETYQKPKLVKYKTLSGGSVTGPSVQTDA